MNATLSKHEINALVSKYRTNSLGRVSERLKYALADKGLISVDWEGRTRLTEAGKAEVEAFLRSQP